MNLPLTIAVRYLLSRKSHNAINIISWISVCGVAIATMAMVCTLSVFNGFQELYHGLFGAFDPQIKIMPKEGKVFDPTSGFFPELRDMAEVKVFTEVLEENAFLIYKDRQIPATIKGVSDNFEELTSIDSLLISGSFVLNDGVADYGVIGIGLASALNVGFSVVDPVEIYAPIRDAELNMINPLASLTKDYLFLASIFSVEQPEYDEKYLIVSIDFARELFRYEKEVSAIELKLKPDVSVSSFKSKIRNELGEDFYVLDRYEQQVDFYKMMNVEKWMAFLILSFILLIATFNIIGSISMLIFDKKDDIITLRNIGADDSLINRIFLFEGRIISMAGAIMGIILGIALVLIQDHFGILRLGAGTSFLVDAYPVKLEIKDLLISLVTVLSIGLLASWYPVRYLGTKWLKTL